MADERTAPLSGNRVLVVEDEYYLADDLSRELRAAGAGVVGPFGSIADPEAAIDIGDFDCAVLDMNLRGDLAFMIAEQLASAKVPFIVATGYNQSSLPESLNDTQVGKTLHAAASRRTADRNESEVPYQGLAPAVAWGGVSVGVIGANLHLRTGTVNLAERQQTTHSERVQWRLRRNPDNVPRVCAWWRG